MSDFVSSQPSGYRPSGNCDWLMLLTIAMPLGLLAACGLAVVLMQAFVCGFYYLLIMPALAGLLLGLAAAGLFRFAHCRNPFVAAILGCLLGTVMYLGYFHCRLVHFAGWQALGRIDVLPRFIDWHMHQDVIRGMHDVGNRNQRPEPVMNWIWFAGDWLAAACSCACVVYTAARRAYCETCMRWMVRKKAATTPGKAGLVAAAVSGKRIASLPELLAVQAKGNAASSQFEVEYCPGNADQTDICPIYFTAKEVLGGKKRPVYVARQVPLTVEELAALSAKLNFK